MSIQLWLINSSTGGNLQYNRIYKVILFFYFDQQKHLVKALVVLPARKHLTNSIVISTCVCVKVLVNLFEITITRTVQDGQWQNLGVVGMWKAPQADTFWEFSC